VLFRGDSELVEEGMMPDSLHIIPVVNDTVLDGILEVEDTSLGLGLVSDISFFAVHTNHYTWVLGSSDDSGETTSWCIISSNTGFALTGSIINNNCSLIFSHF
jgi:hypothetical protein